MARNSGQLKDLLQVSNQDDDPSQFQFQSTLAGEIPEISVDYLFTLSQSIGRKFIRLVDVRRKDEFNNELGHIQGSQLITLGSELSEALLRGDRSQHLVLICRSGARSGEATREALRLGYHSVVNLTGGMIQWNEKQLPVERN